MSYSVVAGGGDGVKFSSGVDSMIFKKLRFGHVEPGIRMGSKVVSIPTFEAGCVAA